MRAIALEPTEYIAYSYKTPTQLIAEEVHICTDNACTLLVAVATVVLVVGEDGCVVSVVAVCMRE